MAFFDNIGKQISNVTQNVAQQTKNLADTAQLNSAISEKQNKIQQLYLQLGQIYYELHKADPSAQGFDAIQQVSALFDEIDQCRQKIAQIRGDRTCPRCGKTSPASAQFCSSCGFTFEKPTAPAADGNVCSQCGAPVVAGNLFCTHCGNKL